MSFTAGELERFVRGLVATPELWRGHVRHSDDLRICEQIWDDDEVNAWVICWSEDQDTGFHDHDESAAAIAVISGHVRDERLVVGASGPNACELGAGDVFTVPPVAIHRVLHVGEAPAVTIHAYSPPLQRTGAYEVGENGELLRVAHGYDEELRAEAALA
jgi:mannose-6-phosphate isomerase-like protein (cupin superfamily)